MTKQTQMTPRQQLLDTWSVIEQVKGDPTAHGDLVRFAYGLIEHVRDERRAEGVDVQNALRDVQMAMGRAFVLVQD